MNGVVLSRAIWSVGGRRVDFVEADGVTPRHAFEGARFTSIRREFDDQGRLSREQYFGPTGGPRPDENGVYGGTSRYGRTPGARIERTRLAADGEPAASNNGTTTTRCTDDDVPDGREMSWYDVDGKPYENDGSFREVHTWNGVDVTSVANFGPGGEPTVARTYSVHEQRTTFDPTSRVWLRRISTRRGGPRSSGAGGRARFARRETRAAARSFGST